MTKSELCYPDKEPNQVPKNNKPTDWDDRVPTLLNGFFFTTDRVGVELCHPDKNLNRVPKNNKPTDWDDRVPTLLNGD